MRLRSFSLAVALSLSLAACATAPARSPFDDVRSLQQRLDERGLGFGLTRIPGEDGVLLQVRFRTSSEDDASAPVTEASWREAAEAAAPQGCVLDRLEPTEDASAYRAFYRCA